MAKIVSEIGSCFSKMLKKIYGRANSDGFNVQRQYNVELELIEGIHKNTNLHPSIIHFSYNKAATQYVKSILVEAAKEIGMAHAGINEYAFNSKFPYLDHLTAEEMKKYQHILKKKGYLYSVFGGMIENIPDLETYKVVMGVRDPRDMLVSGYYSQAFSHPAPDTGGDKFTIFLEKRERAKASTIDQYALDESIKIHTTFKKYQNLLLKQYSHVYVVKYEDMIVDFSGWLNGLLHYCDLEVSDTLKRKIISENERLRPVKEDIGKHIRKGQPGDYKAKLQPLTIHKLNQIFSEMLELYGYEK